MSTVYNPLQLVEHCTKCGIKLPSDTNADADWETHPHWALLQVLHMEHAIPISAVASNLRIIASLSDEEASEVSDKELRRRGFQFGDEEKIEKRAS
jgi:hypothetical protein